MPCLRLKYQDFINRQTLAEQRDLKLLTYAREDVEL